MNTLLPLKVLYLEWNGLELEKFLSRDDQNLARRV